MAYDIVTFGSATQDIFIKSSALKVFREKKDNKVLEKICLPYGSKIEIKDIIFTSGGGGSNTAFTFAKQGFKVAFIGAVGQDNAGKEILKELKEAGIDTQFLRVKKNAKTNHSIVLSPTGKNKTLLIYRGASELLTRHDIPWNKIKKTKWFYLAPLTGRVCDFCEQIVNFAYKNKIKLALNPSLEQLSFPFKKIKRIFEKTDILFLNKREAIFFTKIISGNEIKILKKIKSILKGIAVMTKGQRGVLVFDGTNLYSAKPFPKRVVVDATGAGDSFASGFLSNFIRTNGNIEKSIQLGMANATSNLRQIGAKTGILNKNDYYPKVRVFKKLII